MPSLWYTSGPASSEKAADLIRAGADGVRLTFSHATAEHQAELAAFHRQLADEMGRRIYVMADLAGEKFRLGAFEGPRSVDLPENQMVELYHGNSCSPDETGAFAVPSDRFFAGISAGDLVTVGDGSAVLCIDSVDAQNARARARIRVGGVINQRRGLTVQGGDFRPSCLTEKDLADLEFIAGANVFDAVALSFVADAANVERARRLLAGSDRDILLVAKIETEAGLENLEAICRAADVIMAARGDLALAMPWVELPAAVLAIQEAARYARKPWILGTQVAEGLERFAIPTRAEICDLANWMRTGCDGVLLSYETAFGARPIEAVRTVRTVMDRWSA